MDVSIEIAGLGKTCGQVTVVGPFSLSVPQGQVLGLVGPNGSGKTVILKMIAGLLPPDTGNVRLDGYDLLGERDLALGRVAPMIQGDCRVDDRLSVWENVFPGTDGEVEQLLHDLDLWECRDEPVGTLSSGVQRKVRLAAVLGADRSILLLDEPMAGLDTCAAGAAGLWIKKLAHEQSRTVVLATCHVPLAQELCDRVVVLQGGRLVVDVPMRRTADLDRPATYYIRVKSGLDPHWTRWFGGLTVTTVQGETIISGTVVDQPALYGLLVKIRDLGLSLISLQRIEPGLETGLSQ